jgi:hypothetical protein
MRDPLRELEHLGNLAAADPVKRFGTLYRLVCHRELLRHAGERVRQNTGGRTAGIDGQTRRHIDDGVLDRLAEELAHHRYHPQAVRRAYIPKGKTGRRALGMPTVCAYCTSFNERLGANGRPCGGEPDGCGCATWPARPV